MSTREKQLREAFAEGFNKESQMQSAFMEGFKAELEKIAADNPGFLSQLGGTMAKMPGVVKDWAGNAADVIGGTMSKVPDVIRPYTDPVADAIGGTIDKVPDVLGDAASNTSAFAQSVNESNPALSGASDFVAGGMGNIDEVLRSILANAEQYGESGAPIMDAIRDTGAAQMGQAAGVPSNLGSMAADAAETGKGLYGSAKDVTTDYMKKMRDTYNPNYQRTLEQGSDQADALKQLEDAIRSSNTEQYGANQSEIESLMEDLGVQPENVDDILRQIMEREDANASMLPFTNVER